MHSSKMMLAILDWWHKLYIIILPLIILSWWSIIPWGMINSMKLLGLLVDLLHFLYLGLDVFLVRIIITAWSILLVGSCIYSICRDKKWRKMQHVVEKRKVQNRHNKCSNSIILMNLISLEHLYFRILGISYKIIILMKC